MERFQTMHIAFLRLFLIPTLLPLYAALPTGAVQDGPAVPAPQVVGVPPSDAGRGLVRVSGTEIRHYSGDKKPLHYLVSRDNGLTWSDEKAPAGYPPNFGGIPKESPDFAQNPRTKEYIRVQPIRGFVFISQGGLDGKWLAVTKDGKLTADWRDGRKQGDLLVIPGIIRSPLFIAGGRRLLLPTHGNGTTVYISDDGGLNWRKSKVAVTSPPHEIGGEHKGLRWQNNAVEATIVELRDGRLWMLVRTSQDSHYESFSTDRGETWSKAVPSRFHGTLTMPTLGKLNDGRLLALWTNTHPLPELPTATGSGEDAFTNRDSIHAAISNDDGKTWNGFREVILDEHRNRADYATSNGSADRGKHQSQFVQLDANRVLISIGQHKSHRRLVIMDTRWLYEKTRSCDFSDGLASWTHHTFIPAIKGHCAYNRTPAAELVANPDAPEAKAMRIAWLDNPALVNEKNGADYRRGGATWNFPSGTNGQADIAFRLTDKTAGVRLSLTDTLFNACDTVLEPYALYTLKLAPGEKIGSETLKAGESYRLSLKWNGADKGSSAELFLDGRKVGTLPLNAPSLNGVSYLHFVSMADGPDSGTLIQRVSAKVK